ncbi:hypothetical protein Hden_1200 [Hyphomicrobium denitrificans ATCC 51888]|uniref:Uncharacterized protein n=1 Tax=Hyphomicrobium denitrificans (strain ATCC 51888 / DSM 1869 / NCIMB 11706 / TK 0415) TaxID=582899 RepID=D8JVX4_HYPDA|nr:hypothetical protein [Hyphomicrobium denitrificans]ADJ23013.1 hypothetical protein Hden_1200 [Hyphomicrobium denitrificans ATCC 51888]
MFTLTQWLQLAGVISLPCIAAWLVTGGAKSMVDRDIRRYREIDKVLEIKGDR